jgi:hypothetical protein
MKVIRGWCIALGVLVNIFVVPHAVAGGREGASPYRAQMSLSRVYEVAASTRSRHELEAIPTVKVQGRVHGVGFVDARFNLRRNKTWSSSMQRNGRELPDSLAPVLLQGKLAVGGAWKSQGRRIHPTAASIIGNELKVTFPGRARGSKQSRQRVYTIRMTLDGSIVIRARVASIPRAFGRRGACAADVGSGAIAGLMSAQGVHTAHVHEGLQSGTQPPSSGAEQVPTETLARVVTISTDADQEWYQKYGERSNAVIASIINTAEALYNRQLGLRFRIVKQHVYADASPYVSADPGELLGTFTRNPANPVNLGMDPATLDQDVDVKHLFTGKDMTGSVIGVAFIGVVCAAPTLSYGVTQAFQEIADPGIFAHELGHNFGAGHDASTREGLMYPAISIPPAERFSDISLAEVSAHLEKYGSCLGLENVIPRTDVTPGPGPFIPDEPPLEMANLSIRRDRVGDPRDPVVRISGTLTAANGKLLSAVGVRLLVSGDEVGQTVTSETGTFKFFVRMQLPRGRKVYLNVETLGGEVYSNYLWLGRTLPINRTASRSSRQARR